MDFYSPLIPPGGFKAEPNGERSLRGVVRGKVGHCNFKLNVLEPGQGVMQKWKVFLVGIMILLELQVIGCTYNVTPCKLPSIKTIC